MINKKKSISLNEQNFNQIPSWEENFTTKFYLLRILANSFDKQ